MATDGVILWDFVFSKWTRFKRDHWVTVNKNKYNENQTKTNEQTNKQTDKQTNKQQKQTKKMGTNRKNQ